MKANTLEVLYEKEADECDCIEEERMARLDHSKLDTYFGVRKPIDLVNISLNMYAFIKFIKFVLSI